MLYNEFTNKGWFPGASTPGDQIRRENEMTNIKAVEDNAGGISIFALDQDRKLIWGSLYTYELGPKEAAEDYKRLLDGADPVAEGWEWEYGEFDDFAQVKEAYQHLIENWEDEFNGGFSVLAEDGLFFPEAAVGSYNGRLFLQELGVAVDW